MKKRFGGLSLYRKISIGFVVVIIFSSVAGMVGYLSILRIHRHYLNVAQGTFPTVAAFSEVKSAFQMKNAAQILYIRGRLKEGNGIWEKSDVAFHKNIIILKRLVKNNPAIKYLVSFDKIYQLEKLDNDINMSKESLIAAQLKGGTEAALNSLALKTLIFATDEGFSILNDLQMSIEALETVSQREITRTIQISLLQIALIIILIIYIAAIISYFLTKAIAEPVLSLTDAVKRVGAGESMCILADEKSKDEVEILANAFNDMINNLDAAGKELKESEEKFRCAFESSRVGLNILGSDYKYQVVNKAFCDMIGYSEEELVSSHFRNITHPDDIEPNMALSKKLRAGEIDSFQMEKRYIHKNGHVIWGSLSVSAVMAAGEKLIYVIALVEDITERKKAEEALSSSEEKYRLLFSNMLDSFALHEMVLDENDKPVNYIFLEVNDAFETMTGLKRADLIGKKVTEALPGIENDAIDWICVYGKVALTGEEVRFKQYSEHLGKWYSVYAYRPRENQFAVIFEDITERKQLEQQLIHTEKLSSIGTFVSGVAHELNNPLTAILGYAELLQDDYESLPQNIKEDLDNIKTQSERAAEIVHNLLRFTRKKKPEKSSVKINDVLENSISLHEYSLKTSSIEIIKDYKDGLPLIYADVNHLQQVFTNIVLNFQYEITKAHGKGIITIKSKKSRSNIVVTLENDGPPIPEEQLSKIFDPFFTTKSIGEGTGLGLYVSYGIVQDHGGNMWAENIGKSGVRFVITLPIYDEKVEKSEYKTRKTADLQGKQILFVDDEEILREWMTRALTKEGIVVQSVSSGEEAVDLIEQSEFDIVISDVKMPGMNGLELGRWLHKNRPDYLKRFILATGAIEPEIETYCSKNKCRLITKPFQTKKLLEAVSEIVLQKEADS